MSDTWDADDHTIARALDADEPNDGIPVDDDAVADYEAVLAVLPFDEVEPAEDLEDRVVAAALSRRPAAVRSIEPRSKVAAPARGRAWMRWSAAGVAAAAAAVIVVVLLAGRTPSSPSSTLRRIEPAAATGDVAGVLAEPGTRQGVLRAPSGAAAGRVALDPHGSGYLVGMNPTGTASGRWLWLDTSAGPVRVGRLPASSTVHFVVRGDASAVRGVIVSPSSSAASPVSLRALLS